MSIRKENSGAEMRRGAFGMKCVKRLLLRLLDIDCFQSRIRVSLSLAVVVALHLLQGTWPGVADTNAASHIDRRNAGFYFAASVKSAAFPVRTREGNVALLFVDFETGKQKKLNSAGSRLLSPYLSPDGTRLLFVRQPYDRQGHEVISCETGEFVCRRVVKSAGSIESPIEISDRRILYASSAYHVGPDGKGRYARNDFWVSDGVNEARQLTDMQFYELTSISVTNDEVYFSAEGPRFDKPVIPKTIPLAPERSDIFKLPFDPTRAEIKAPVSILRPLFVSGGIATWSSVAPDGSLIAFLRTRTDIGAYRYDVVIVDQKSQTSRLLESSGLGFSRPVVAGGNVFVRDILDDRYVIKMIAPNEPAKTLVEIPDASIDRSESQELKITQDWVKP
jgi:hypothetical protein